MMTRLPLTFVLLFVAFGFIIGHDANAQSPVDLGITINPLQISCGSTPGVGLNTITVTIHNYGSVAQTSFPIEYRIYPNWWNTASVVAAPLAPNSSITYTFTQQANLSNPGTYMIIARLYPDSNPSNDADTIYITNSNMPQGNVNMNFETATNGSDAMRKVINANSGITESAAASNGASSIKGLIMDGKNSTNWVTPGGTNNPWTSNPGHFSAAYICFNPDSGKVNDTLRLSFDLKQLYKTSHNNTNFRVTVNGQQVGPTYTPPAGGYGGRNAPWNRISLDFSSFIGSPSLEIGLESSVKEEYDNGNGTANLIDNMDVERISARAGATGTGKNVLQSALTVYPNPSAGIFNIALPDDKTYQLEITDLTGKVLKKQTVNTKLSQLNLQEFTAGLYLLKVSGKDAIAIRQLIVK